MGSSLNSQSHDVPRTLTEPQHRSINKVLDVGLNISIPAKINIIYWNSKAETERSRNNQEEVANKTQNKTSSQG